MGNTHAKACGSSSAGAVAAPPTPATEPETLYQSYNVIIVGSGLGGLSAASTLAQASRRTLLPLPGLSSEQLQLRTATISGAALDVVQTRGLRCLVVEQHWTPGGASGVEPFNQTPDASRCVLTFVASTPFGTAAGMTHQFLRKDGEKEYWFSTGTHYVGQLGGGNMMSKLMAFVSKNVIWDKLPDEVGLLWHLDIGL